ncbi:MAG: hypothetical protein AAB401_00175, partial [Acidobacteriota bacterium]
MRIFLLSLVLFPMAIVLSACNEQDSKNADKPIARIDENASKNQQDGKNADKPITRVDENADKNRQNSKNADKPITRVDENIGKVKEMGTSIVEVIGLLGKPDEAWRSVDQETMLLIYRGRQPYSILLDST